MKSNINTKYLVFILTFSFYYVIFIVMIINKNISDADILIELGKRIKAARIRKSYTQVDLSKLSGLSKGTVANIENGDSIQLGSLLKIFRELDSLNSLELLLPASESSPMELIQTKQEKVRQRVRKKQNFSEQSNSNWKWGEDK